MAEAVIIEGTIAQINLNAIAGVVVGAEVLAATPGEGAIVQQTIRKTETKEARTDREEILIIEEISLRIDIKEILVTIENGMIKM